MYSFIISTIGIVCSRVTMPFFEYSSIRSTWFLIKPLQAPKRSSCICVMAWRYSNCFLFILLYIIEQVLENQNVATHCYLQRFDLYLMVTRSVYLIHLLKQIYNVSSKRERTFYEKMLR